MPDARRQRRVYALEYNNKRVGRNDEVDQHTRVEKQLFYRMHCQTCPRTRIDIVMMQIVNPPVDDWNVEKAMYKIEMNSPSPNWHEKEQRC